MEKILIIDDSPVQASLLASILKDEYDITVANTAQAGLDCVRSEAYSLILSDVVMPDMDGFMLLKTLQEELVTRHIPVILITSLSDIQNEERGLTLGAVDYIAKPFHAPIVKARVHTHIKLYQYRAKIEQEAHYDELTGAANRRYYDQQSVSKWQEAIRLKVPFSVCMFDIDKFKLYNDHYGHPAGDKVIAAVAQTASGFLRRNTDFFARYGGEEFVAVILGGTAAEVFEHLKKVRKAVEDLHIEHKNWDFRYVTVSIGGVTVIPKLGDEYRTYLQLADTMLYDAKRFGRNQVVWSNERMVQWREK